MKNNSKIQDIMDDVKDDSNSFSKEEIESGNLMGIISYLSFLALIPFFCENKNKYVMYHTKQGLNLFVVYIIGSLGISIFTFLMPTLITNLLTYAFNIFIIILSTIGIINVCNGKAKELPIINKLKIIK